MSDIPKARKILQAAIAGDNSYSSIGMYCAIVEALELLDRKKPKFVARAYIPALTFRQKADARKLREQGMPMHQIAIRLGTNHGRISEALSEHE